MTRSLLITLGALAALSLPAAAQKSGCLMVTDAEASAILGSPVEKQAFSTTCVYKVKGATTSIVARTFNNTPQNVENAKNHFAKSGKITDESSLAKGAFSATRSDSTRVYVVKNDTLLMISYEDISRKPAPADMLGKLKAAATKALTRI